MKSMVNNTHCPVLGSLRRTVLISVFLLIFVSGLHFGEGRDTLVLQLKWFHQFQFAGYYMASEKGFYSEQDLNVEIREGGPDIPVDRIVDSGEADFGVLGSELIISRANGLNLVVLAPVMQHSMRTIIARADRNIQSIHDLGGKTVMLNINELPEFEAMFRSEGMDLNQLSVIPKDRTANAKFIAGEIDAMNGSIANQPFLFRNRNIEVVLIRPVNYGIDFYGDTLFTTEDHAEKEPETVQAFLDASLKGWEYAFSHPGETIRVIIEKFNSAKTEEQLFYEYQELRDLIHPDLVEIGQNSMARWERILHYYQELGIVDDSFSFDGFYFDPSGDRMRLITRLFVVIAALGGIILLFFLISLIRNRKLRFSLRSREFEMMTLMQNLPGMVYSCRMDQERTAISVSGGSFALTGYKPEEYMQSGGITFHQIVAPPFQAQVRERIVNSGESGNQISMEYQIQCADGSVKWVWDHFQHVSNIVSRSEYFYGYMVDISLQKKDRNEVGRLRNLLSNMIDSMPSLLIGIDSDCRVSEWNRTAVHFLRISRDQASDKSVFELVPTLESYKDNIAGSIESGEIFSRHNEPFTLFSASKYIDITVYPLKGTNPVAAGAVIRIDDVTRQHQQDEQAYHSRKMEAIGQLASGVAHDFNNMLGGILNASQLLKAPKHGLNEKGLEYVDIIREAAIRVSRLTKKLLAFGRKGSITSTGLDLHLVIDEAMAILSQTINKKVMLSVRKQADSSMIAGDYSILENVFLNMGINANQAMPDGGSLSVETSNVRLTKVYCESSSFDINPGEFCRVTVSDTGIGIPEEDLDRIFEPFYSTKEPDRGTGLGLASVYASVVEHKGAIEVLSKKKEGTIFSIFLPCLDPDQPVELKLRKPVVKTVSKNSGRILLVDDEELLRYTGQEILTEIGFDVILAEDGVEAVRIFRERHDQIDLVMLDLIMPKQDGYETFEKIREIQPDSKVIAVSGFASDEKLQVLMEGGLAGFLHKPYTMRELQDLLDRILKPEPE